MPRRGRRGRRYVFRAGILMLRSAGFQTCRIADFQVGSAALRPAGLETRGTADLEVCATLNRYGRANSDLRGGRLWPIIQPKQRQAVELTKTKFMKQRPLSTLIFGILNIGYGLLKLAGLAFAAVMARIKMPANANIPSMNNDPTFIAWSKFAFPLGAALGLALIAFGIGLLLLKNWARLGSVVYSVIDIVLVVVGTIVMWPVTQRMMEQVPNVPRGMMAGFASISLVFQLIFGLAYPALLLFFVTRDNVIDACQPGLLPPPPQEPV
jgi:uncharacterized membrane protein YidH (DUF202 family)